jgi:hypothetical protein
LGVAVVAVVATVALVAVLPPAVVALEAVGAVVVVVLEPQPTRLKTRTNSAVVPRKIQGAERRN